VEDYALRAAELGQPALALTDHGVMCGLPQFYKACRKNNIEPILGEEFYFVHDASFRPPRGQPQMKRYHVVILAKGERGYRALSELSTAGHARYHYKPLIDPALVESLDCRDDLIVLSGCAGSVISQAVLDGDMAEAERWAMWWREMFPHFYIELQNHNTEFDRRLNRGLLKIARKYGIPWVVTNDPHYVVKEDCGHHDTLLAIQTASDIDDPTRFRFDGDGYHLRSRAEMARQFRKYDDEVWKEGARNTLKVAKMAYTRIPSWESRTWQLPTLPGIEDADEYIKRLCVRELKRRGWWDKPEYRKRTAHELRTIRETGIAHFLLITRDGLEWAKSVGIPVGPGRGSVCGCLVAYLIGIHKIDPVKYDLMFERFLNPARPKMPDIDSDFGQLRREEIFDYTEERFGRENVIKVAAFQNMKTKAAFQSLAKAHGVSFADRVRISKTLDEDDENANLPEEITANYPELAAQLKRLSGIKRSISSHPAGVIIAAPEARIREQVPEMWVASSKKWVGSYDLDAVEDMGLMKQDYLGLRTLDTIALAVKFIEETTGEVLDPDSWEPDDEPDDKKVYKLLARGHTGGVFQMEGATNTRGIVAIKPRCFEDIVSCTSLYRTGAISAGFPDIFLRNRLGSVDDIPYAHPMLKPILEGTWGVVLYQEQVMEIGRSLGGFTMIQVDDIKEAIKHKKSTLMQSMKPLFVKGCKKNGISKSTALEIWKMIEGYSGYGYNRSHAVAYSFTTYQTARLKALYQLQFMTALLATVDTSNKDGKAKRDRYLRECVGLGYKILPADVNKSGIRMTVDDLARKRIRFGLQDLAGIGLKTAQKLQDARPAGGWTSVEELRATAGKRAFEALQYSGALESLDILGDEKRMDEIHEWQFHDPMTKYRAKYADRVQLPNPELDGENVSIIGMINTAERRQSKNNKTYMTWRLDHSTTESYTIRLWSSSESCWSIPKGSVVIVTGRWDQEWGSVSVGQPSQVRVIRRASA
jgi:DNA polymerase III subunit alpha